MKDDLPNASRPPAKVIPIRRKRVIHMGRLDENAKMPPPGTVITGIQIRKPDGTVVLDERIDPPVITK